MVSATLPAYVDRTRPPITVGGDPVCVALRGDSLLVADGYSGAIIGVTGESQRKLATVDSGGMVSANRVGGLAIGTDHTFYATRTGEGQVGAILAFDADGRSTALANVPAKVWQGALAFDAKTHRLYATQYLRSRNGAYDGEVVEVDQTTGTCSSVIDGFLHPTGIAALGNVLVVADARRRAVFRIDLAGGRGVFCLQLSAAVERPEAVCACGDTAVLVTSTEDETGIGTVRRIDLDGSSQIIAQGPWEPRGVCCADGIAYVATRRSGVLSFEL
jgi:sugar lactone lactonase YvrE